MLLSTKTRLAILKIGYKDYPVLGGYLRIHKSEVVGIFPL
jgi:hypothetical protein